MTPGPTASPDPYLGPSAPSLDTPPRLRAAQLLPLATARRDLVAERHGEGPAVVLLHGQPGSARDWDRVVPRLSSDFTVIVPDRLGYGRTGGSAGGFAVNAGALADLLDRLEIHRAVITAHSWAGGVALAFAGLYPMRTSGLVLVSSVGPGERFGWDDRLLAAPVLGEALAALTIGAAGRILASERVQELARRRLSGRSRQAVTVLTSLTGALTGPRAGAAVWRSFVVEQRALLRETDALAPTLPLLSMPTTVLHGSVDHIVPAALAGQLAASIPGARLQMIAGANHLLPLRYPGAVAGAVRDVAAQAETAGAPDVPAGAQADEETAKGAKG